jgi:DNA adenine methylase
MPVPRGARRTSSPGKPARPASPFTRSGPRPLLKWAGGKRQLLPVLRTFYAEHFGAYVEPFVGSGAVFFDLLASGRLDGHEVRLADNNADLVGCYLAVRDQADAVLASLAELDRQHRESSGASYYEVRDRFNATRAAIGRVPDPASYPPALAAMLIYLNRTGFNGLFRLNARGHFNVPAGRHANPGIHDPQLVRTVSGAFARPGVTLRRQTFEEAAVGAAPGDFLYFDPPYEPLSHTSSFGAYTADRFTPADQRRLRDLVVQLAARGCHVLVSNSSAPLVLALYEEAVRGNHGARLSLWQVAARRSINSRASARGEVAEVLLTNMVPTGGAPAGARLVRLA